MKRILGAIAAASWLVACGGGSTMTTTQSYDQMQTQKPVSPKGSIIGRVLDVGTGGPLEGATVKVLGSDAAVGPTNADGVFRLDGAVVNSNYTFIIEKAGYLRIRTNTSINGTSGNSPLEGSISSFVVNMFPSTGSVTGAVFLPNGRPAAGATVYVDQLFNVGVESVVSTQTAMDGTFTLSGLATRPSGVGHTVYAQWYDENGDMQADYATTSTPPGNPVVVFPGQPARVFLTYSATSVGQRIVNSNIVDGEVPAGEDLQFTFALPLFTGVLSGSQARPWVLTHVTGNDVDVPVEGTFMSPTVLRVRPALNSLREGEVYSLSLSLRNLSTSGNTAANFSPTLTFQVRAATVMPYTTQVTGLTVTKVTPIAPFGPTAFDFNSTDFALEFVAAAGAVRYEVYARDTTNNPNYVRLGTSFLSTGAPRYRLTPTLPSQFSAGPSSTPLGGNNRVTFAVVGIDAYGARAPLMSAPTVEVRDTIPPTVSALTGASFLTGTPVDAINDTGTPAEIRIQLSYSEPMDPASMVTYTSTATAAPMVSWRWNPGTANTGILTLTVGQNADSTGTFVIRGGRDMAGNELQRAGDLLGSLGGRRELLQNPEFRTGTMCALTSWMPASMGSGSAPSVVNNNGAISGSTSPCSALLGNAPGSTPGTGTSKLIQNVMLPAVAMTSSTIEASARYRIANVPNASQPGANYNMQCRIMDTGEMMTFGTLFSQAVAGGTTLTGNTFTAATAVSLTAQATNTVRVVCEVENTNMMNVPGFGALYLDEMSVVLVKPGSF